MLDRVLSPVLVGRQDELSQLEDALLSVNRGDGRRAYRLRAAVPSAQ